VPAFAAITERTARNMSKAIPQSMWDSGRSR
jgi:hypothetical protein